MIKKNLTQFLLLFSSSIIAIALMEVIADIYVKNRIKVITDRQKSEYRYRNDKNIIKFKKKYSDRLNHLRGPSAVRVEETPHTNLLFSVLRPFSKINKQNILIQGDSWAEAAKYSQDFIKKFSVRKSFGMVLGGIRSYSPSPMTLQLEILREDFAIHPSIIIAIIDQTDIGDELFRYKDQYVRKSGQLRSLLAEGTTQIIDTQTLTRENNYISSKFSLVKLLNHVFLHFKGRANRNLPDIVLGRDILSPLINGVDIRSDEIFSYRLNRYINTVFDDTNIKYLILTTHPHRKHLVDNKNEKRFKGEVGTLVNQVVINSKYKEKIIHIDFLQSNNIKFLIKNLETVFIKDDPFSHLTPELYSDYYYPFIFSMLKDH